MSADEVIVRPGPVAVPLDYKLPVGTEIIPKVVTATLDGTSAGGSFLAVLEVISPNGTVTARCLRQEAIAAGASASVSWFPGGGVDDSAAVDVDTAAAVTAIASPAGTLSVSSPTGPTAAIDMPATGVGAGAYGDATHVAQLQVDAEGRLVAAASVPISGAGGAGGLIVLYDSGYLGADTATLDTGAGGIASGHFCIVVYAYLRSTVAGNNDNVILTLNNDASALYNVNRTQNNGGAVAGAVVALGTSANAGDCPGSTATATVFGAWELVMPAYDGAANMKAMLCRSAMALSPTGQSIGGMTAVTYQSIAAISRLKIAPGTGGANWKAGSRLIVYGTQ